MSEAKLEHYLCRTCNLTQIYQYLYEKLEVPMYAVCGHLFDYVQEQDVKGTERCVVCDEMYLKHEEGHNE